MSFVNVTLSPVVATWPAGTGAENATTTRATTAGKPTDAADLQRGFHVMLGFSSIIGSSQQSVLAVQAGDCTIYQCKPYTKAATYARLFGFALLPFAKKSLERKPSAELHLEGIRNGRHRSDAA
jgi:hypothetical protein